MSEPEYSTMNRAKLGTWSCQLFGLVVFLGIGAAVFYVNIPPPSAYGGEFRSLNQLPWRMGWFFSMATSSVLSIIGLCLGLIGLSRQGMNSTAAVGALLNGLVAVPLAVWWLKVMH